MSIGIQVREVRKMKKLSQQELSKLSGISQTSISQMELGLKNPTKKTLDKICFALNVPVAIIHLLSLDENSFPEKNRQKFELVFPSIKQLLMSIID